MVLVGEQCPCLDFRRSPILETMCKNDCIRCECVFFRGGNPWLYRVLEESVTSKDQEPLLKSPIFQGMPTLHISMWRSSLLTSLIESFLNTSFSVCLECLNILTLCGSINALFSKIIYLHTATPIRMFLSFPLLSTIFDL